MCLLDLFFAVVVDHVGGRSVVPVTDVVLMEDLRRSMIHRAGEWCLYLPSNLQGPEVYMIYQRIPVSAMLRYPVIGSLWVPEDKCCHGACADGARCCADLLVLQHGVCGVECNEGSIWDDIGAVDY